MEGQGDGRHNGPNCYRIPLPIGNGARNMETLGLRVFILNQEIIFSIHAMIRPPDNDMHDDDGNTEDNDEDQNIEDQNVEEQNMEEQNMEDNIEEDDDNVDDVDREENIEDEEDEDDSEDSDGDADVEDNDGEVEDNHHGAHPDYPAEVLVNDENAVLLFRIRVRPLQHGDVFDDIFLELRLVNNDDFDEIDNNEEHNADANVENIDDDDDGFENNNSDDRDRSRDDGGDDDDDDDDALEDDGCRDDEGFEDIDRDRQSVRDRAVVGSVADEETKDALGPAVCRDSDDPLPGPSGERSVQDPDDAGGGKQFQWWDESNSDSFSDNSGEEEERPLRRAGASKRRSSDDVDSQDDKGGKKSRKKNFLSNSEDDEDFACRSGERDAEREESSRKRRRGEGGAPCETGRNQKRFRHGDTSDSEPDEPRRSATPLDRSRDHPEDETRDGRRDFAPSRSTSPAGRIPPVARNR